MTPSDVPGRGPADEPGCAKMPARPVLWRPWWRRPAWLVGLLLPAVALAAWRPWSRSVDDRARYQGGRFNCVRVIDGDTLDIDAADGPWPTTRIRLWGVDTPETAKPDRPAMYFGAEAEAATRAWTQDQPVRLVLAPHQSRDRYDRLLAYVYIADDEITLNERLIEAGFAYADTRFEHPWKKKYLELEKSARKDKRGLWAGVTLKAMPAWRQRYEAWRAGQDRSSTPSPGR